MPQKPGRGRVRAKQAGIRWEVHPRILAQNIETRWELTESFLFSEFKRAAKDILTYAQTHHPWRNRTYEAERNLNVEIYSRGDNIHIDLHHGVPYGIFLEKRWGGKWGVIPMAINYGVPRVRALLDGVMRGW